MYSRKIPFTSAYLPGRRPVIQSLIIYGVAVTLYVSILAAVIDGSLRAPGKAAWLFAILMVIWLVLRRVRRENRDTDSLEFEELPEPAIFALDLGRE